MRDLLLKGDIALRQGIRKVFKKGIVENPHVYKRAENGSGDKSNPEER